MELKPQDIVVAIDLAAADVPTDMERDNPGLPLPTSRRAVSERLGISLGAVSAAYKRLLQFKLIAPDLSSATQKEQANVPALLEFLIHGVKYYSYPKVTGVGKGMATGWSAPVMKGKTMMMPPETPFVWPDPFGVAKGEQVTPIHKSAVNLARANKTAYAILAATDVMRLGSPREQEQAQKLLKTILQ